MFANHSHLTPHFTDTPIQTSPQRLLPDSLQPRPWDHPTEQLCLSLTSRGVSHSWASAESASPALGFPDPFCLAFLRAALCHGPSSA